MKVWLLPEEKKATPGPNTVLAKQRNGATQSPKKFIPSNPIDSLPDVVDAPPSTPQLPGGTRPRRVSDAAPVPQTEVDYTMSLPDVTPNRRPRMDIGEAPIKELKNLPGPRPYTPLTKEQRAGFKGRAKGAWEALQNAGAAGADGGAALGAFIGGLANPERAHQVNWQRTVELPDIQRRQHQEDTLLKRNKAYVDTYKAITEAENADRGYYDKDTEREATRLKLKADALQRNDKMGFDERTAKQKHDWDVTDKTTEYGRTSTEKALDRGSAQTVAQIQADTSRQNNIRTTTTSRKNAQETNATKLSTSKRYPRRLISDLAKKLGESEGDVEKRLIEHGYIIEN